MLWTVREAKPADAPLIVEFNRQLALESEGKVLDVAVLTPGVAAVLADPHKGRYFLAQTEGVVAGQTMITYEWSDWRNGWLWWIQSVYVRPEHRRRGAFRALFEHIEKLARRDGQVIGLRLYVETGNRAAQETYSRLGLKPAGYFVLEKCPLGATR
jgi:GNAT superfamily N-acetyltransferase